MSQHGEQLLKAIGDLKEASNITEQTLADATELLQLGKECDDVYYQVVAHYAMSFYYFNLCNINQCILHAQNAFNLTKKHNISDYFIRSCNILGICYNMTLDHIISLDYFLKGYYRCKEINNYPYLIRINNNIGNIFLYIGLYQKAVEYYWEALHTVDTTQILFPENERYLILLNILECEIELQDKAEIDRIIKMITPLLDHHSTEALNMLVYANCINLHYRNDDISKMYQEVELLLETSEKFNHYERLFFCFNYIKDTMFACEDIFLYKKYLERFKEITDLIEDFSFRIRYQSEYIRYTKRIQDEVLYKEALECYYELNAHNTISKNENYANSLIAKIDLEKLLYERSHILNEREQFKELSEIDGLTQIYNRITAENEIKNRLRLFSSPAPQSLRG